jgi:mRNA interferase MazF
MKTKGKIVLIPFPFDDLSKSKVRPALCLTDPIGPNEHVIVAFITSRIPSSPLLTDIIIEANVSGFAQTGLRVSSTLQVHRLMTVTTGLLIRQLGVFPSDMEPELNKCLKLLFEVA